MKTTLRTAKPAAAVQMKQTAPAAAAQRAFGLKPPSVKSDTFTQWVDRAGKANDKPFDGNLVGADGKTFPHGTPLTDVPAVKPDGKEGQGTIVFVNGMLTPVSQQVSDMKAIANAMGANVIGLHNATEGLAGDAMQSAADVAGIGKNPAVESLTQAMLTELKAGREMHVVAHSQGAVITQRALHAVKAALVKELGSVAAAEKRMELLNIETMGGAGGIFPDGPKYTHHINRKDMVPTVFGLGWDGSIRNNGGGRGATFHYFDYTNSDTMLQHLIDSAYLPNLHA